MNVAVDASVACKWYLDEPLADKARILAESDDLFVAPELILAEVGNAVWKRLRKKEISEYQAREIAWHLPGVFLALVRTAELLDRALEISARLDHPLYDGLYLAVAERWDVPLITADERLINKVRHGEWASRVKSLKTYPASA
jgi:predicted nucleic acid-binding protein